MLLAAASWFASGSGCFNAIHVTLLVHRPRLPPGFLRVASRVRCGLEGVRLVAASWVSPDSGHFNGHGLMAAASQASPNGSRLNTTPEAHASFGSVCIRFCALSGFPK